MSYYRRGSHFVTSNKTWNKSCLFPELQTAILRVSSPTCSDLKQRIYIFRLVHHIFALKFKLAFTFAKTITCNKIVSKFNPYANFVQQNKCQKNEKKSSYLHNIQHSKEKLIVTRTRLPSFFLSAIFHPFSSPSLALYTCNNKN